MTRLTMGGFHIEKLSYREVVLMSHLTSMVEDDDEEVPAFLPKDNFSIVPLLPRFELTSDDLNGEI